MALAGFRIKSLAKGLDRSDLDRKLCLVRVLNYYLKHTELLRDGKKLYLFPGGGSLPKVGFLPILFQAGLNNVYKVAGKDEVFLRLRSVRADEVRALSASWDVLKNVVMSEIWAVCHWRSHNTFTSCYLRDLIEMEERLLVFKLVPAASSSRL